MHDLVGKKIMLTYSRNGGEFNGVMNPMVESESVKKKHQLNNYKSFGLAKSPKKNT